jgi:hypothetical protein
MWYDSRDHDEEEDEEPRQEPMTLEQARDHAVHLAKTGQSGALWSFLVTRDGCRLLDYDHIREKALKGVKLYLDAVKAGTRKPSCEEHCAAVQLHHDIHAINHIAKNYERSGLYLFPKGCQHLKR